MSGIMFEPMELKMKAGENVKEFYSERANITGDAGLDLYVPENITIPAKAIGFKINHNVCCEATIGPFCSNVSYYMYPRSSMGAKTPLRIGNSVGIFDSGYRGPVMGIVDNISDDDFVVEKGTRLFQICPPLLNNPINLTLVDELSDSERGEGGLGSTG